MYRSIIILEPGSKCKTWSEMFYAELIVEKISDHEFKIIKSRSPGWSGTVIDTDRMIKLMSEIVGRRH